MDVITALFIVALAGIASGTITGIAKAIGRRGSRAALADVTAQLAQQAADLEDARSELASQSAQLAELQERVDFAERLLAQVHDRKAIGGDARAEPTPPGA